ncbi:hypothetical protein AtEden1_Chr4g0280701 [Arabidopsis thaliana]
MPSTVGYLNDGDWFSRPISVDSSPPLVGSRPELNQIRDLRIMMKIRSGIRRLLIIANLLIPIDSDSVTGTEAPTVEVEVGSLKIAHLTRGYVDVCFRIESNPVFFFCEQDEIF